jgi:hypothetical protein
LIFEDENVDVIYVSPVPITDETLQYYFKLLGLRTAVDSGNPDDQSDLSRRYKIIIPEALNSFPVISNRFYASTQSTLQLFMYVADSQLFPVHSAQIQPQGVETASSMI